MPETTKLELIDLLEAVRKDLLRRDIRNPIYDGMAFACLSAVWHLKGEPSFVERNDALRAKDDG